MCYAYKQVFKCIFTTILQTPDFMYMFKYTFITIYIIFGGYYDNR